MRTHKNDPEFIDYLYLLIEHRSKPFDPLQVQVLVCGETPQISSLTPQIDVPKYVYRFLPIKTRTPIPPGSAGRALAVSDFVGDL